MPALRPLPRRLATWPVRLLTVLAMPVAAIAIGLGGLELAAHAAASMPAAGPTVKFVLANGSTVADTTNVRALASTTDGVGIDKVDFFVDDQLKYSDDSVPYEFAWDTLAETEGSHTISATATDAKGRTAKARITLTVDNELGKGADALAGVALDALKAGDSDKAARYARRALKVDPNNVAAARAYAGVLQGQGEIVKAVAVLDKVELPADDTVVRPQLVALHVDLADQSDSTDEFIRQCATAVDIYKQLQAARADKLKGRADTDSLMARGDVFFAAHEWEHAIVAYQTGYSGDTAPIACGNRLALAYMAAERTRDAESLLHTFERERKADATTHALLAMNLLKTHHPVQAKDAVADGVADRALPALMVAAYCDLTTGQMGKAREEADQAASIAPSLGSVNLLQSFTDADTTDSRHAVVRALESDPMLPEAYVERAYQAMVGRDANRFQAADALIDFALKLDPTNSYAQMARAVSFIVQKRPNEAEPVLTQLETSEPNAPDVHVAMAVLDAMLDRNAKVLPEIRVANGIDNDRWGDAIPPEPGQLLVRVYKYRRSPVLTPAALYPPKS